MATETIDQTKIEAFLEQILSEAGAALNATLIRIGDELGLYRAMSDAQPLTAAALARRTDTHERYVREWLNAQAASGWVDYDAAAERYRMSPEQG